MAVHAVAHLRQCSVPVMLLGSAGHGSTVRIACMLYLLCEL